MKKTFVLLLLSISLFSCQLEDMPYPPVIESLELGYQNSGKAMAGGDLHFDAEITAEGRIDIIRVEIAFKEALPSNPAFEWRIDTLYLKHKGALNTDLHEHVDVPEAALPGIYQFLLTATDLYGQSTAVRSEFEVSPYDPDHDHDDH